MKKLEKLIKQHKKLGEEIKKLQKKDIFSRVGIKENYFVLAPNGGVTTNKELGTFYDDDLFNNYNYCTDKAFLEKRQKGELLQRKLEQFAYLNNDPDFDVYDISQSKYFIRYNYEFNILEVFGGYYGSDISAIYFSSRKIAEKAIEKFGNEILDIYEKKEEFNYE